MPKTREHTGPVENGTLVCKWVQGRLVRVFISEDGTTRDPSKDDRWNRRKSFDSLYPRFMIFLAILSKLEPCPFLCRVYFLSTPRELFNGASNFIFFAENEKNVKKDELSNRCRKLC